MGMFTGSSESLNSSTFNNLKKEEAAVWKMSSFVTLPLTVHFVTL